jgi:diacylglycerol kinase family enzyme
MRVRAIVNRGGGTLLKSGGDDLDERLRAAFAARGVDAEVSLVPSDEIAPAFAEAARAEGLDAVVAGGGDGTISCAAGRLAGTGRALGILPLGTLNHLARDAGIPTDLDEAVATVAEGAIRPLDVGEVNGRVFVNNSAIGLYPRMVRRREALQQQLGRGKRHAMLSASLHAFRRFHRHRLTIDLHGLEAPLETPLLFVGNNRYEMNLLSLGTRTALDGGELCLYAPLVRSRLHFFGLGVRTLLGLGRQSDFVTLCGVEEATVRSRRPLLTVSIDGETAILETPLRYRIRAGALRLIVPRAEPTP